VELAVEIAGRITRRAIAADPDAVGTAMETALSMVMRPTRVVIAVHPKDLERAMDLLPGLLGTFPRAGDVSVTADDSLEGGGCVLRTAGGAAIDTEVATQLDRIARAILPGGDVP
ncbi:MAG TPA: FliH/SctL family protein, partial [Phycisphaerales bacterium]|nr:FliH/SctL family protein [Phycisphaerales bacterium]